jgi:large subunit ribosomal protein L24
MPEIRKGDTVKVIAGKEKGKSGKVLEVLREQGRVRVEKLMTVKRHLRKGRSQTNPQGGIIEKSGTIAISNVMVVGKDGEPVRREKIGRELGAKEKERIEKRKASAGSPSR